MSRFYVVYFVFIVLVALNRLAICVMYPLRELFYCLKLNKLNVLSPEYLQPIGPRIVLLPGWHGYKDDVVTPVEKISMMRQLKLKGCNEERTFVSAPMPPSALVSTRPHCAATLKEHAACSRLTQHHRR